MDASASLRLTVAGVLSPRACWPPLLHLSCVSLSKLCYIPQRSMPAPLPPPPTPQPNPTHLLQEYNGCSPRRVRVSIVVNFQKEGDTTSTQFDKLKQLFKKVGLKGRPQG